MFEDLLALLKNISDFVAKILDAIKQAFESLKPVKPEDSTDEAAA